MLIWFHIHVDEWINMKINKNTTHFSNKLFQYNDQRNQTTPSYVIFTDTERLTRDSDKNQITINVENTIFNTKQLIWRFSDSIIQEDIKHWSFKMINEMINH